LFSVVHFLECVVADIAFFLIVTFKTLIFHQVV